jgi:uncharacterized membrane protein YbhN (UPF0104 family)
MAGKFLRAMLHTQPAGAFAVRGRAIRTFASLALVLALGLAILGVYLINDEFRNPLASQSIGLFAAAFVLATAMTLLMELSQMVRRGFRQSGGGPQLPLPRVDLTARIQVRTTYQPRDQRTDLPYQRNYVDRVRVRG